MPKKRLSYQQLLQYSKGLKDRIIELELYSVKQSPDDQRIDKTKAALVERVKELNCLYEIAKLSMETEDTIEGILKKALKIVRTSWQYPDITCVRIGIDHLVVETDNFDNTPWKQKADIESKEGPSGFVEVCYLEERPPEIEGPFLREERYLLDTLARALANIVNVKIKEDVLRESEERYSSLVENAREGVIIVQESTIRYANRTVAEMLGYEEAGEVTGKKFSDFINTGSISGSGAALHEIVGLDSVGDLHEIELLHRDRSTIQAEILANVIRYMGEPAVMAMIRDISSRRNIEKRITSIAERERSIIGQELHDGICQYLAGIIAASTALEKSLAGVSTSGSQTAAQIHKTAQEAIEEARNMARTLRPVQISPEGFMSSLLELAYSVEKLHNVNCRCHYEAQLLIDDASVSSQLYRIVQEAINNAIKHGNAKSIDINLIECEERICLEILDDGVGIEEARDMSDGMGLNIMHHRARMIGASLDVTRNPEGGTLVRCTIPKTP